MSEVYKSDGAVSVSNKYTATYSHTETLQLQLQLQWGYLVPPILKTDREALQQS